MVEFFLGGYDEDCNELGTCQAQTIPRIGEHIKIYGTLYDVVDVFLDIRNLNLPGSYHVRIHRAEE